MLLPLNKGGRIVYEREDDDGERLPARMSGQAIYDVVRRRQKEAGVKKLSPRLSQDLRRGFAGRHRRLELIRLGGHLNAVG